MGLLEEFYNIYCDESRVENPDSKKMVIGALIIPRVEKKHLAEELKLLFVKYKFNYELKWVKASDRYLEFYKALLDYFFSKEVMNYRCIIVDKSSVDYVQYHNDDQELAFFKFYYLMLRYRLLDFKRYYIALDKKPTRDKNRARALHAYLKTYILLNKLNCKIEHLQAYHSHENILLQMVDFLTGVMGYAANDPSFKKDSIKKVLAHYLKEKTGRQRLLETTPLKEEKFNVFVWKGTDGKKS